MSLHADIEADAKELLKDRGYTCTRVVSVDRDSILYLNGLGNARTAWLHHQEGRRVEVETAQGFAATEPDGLHVP